MGDSAPRPEVHVYGGPMLDGTPRTPDALRDYNRARVLTALRSELAGNRAELCAVTGLARSTVTGLVAELLADGVVMEGEDPGSGTPAGNLSRRAGRPARRLMPVPRSDLVVAIDFGHSHCQIGIVDAQSQVLVAEWESLDVDSSADLALEHARRRIGALLDQLGADRSRVVAAGIGLPAPVNGITGMVGPGNILPGWVDRHPAEELRSALGFPVVIDNDANLGALGEIACGAARGFADVIYVKVSTGIGAGMVLGGRLYRGSTGRAGEIGHVPVDAAGALCRCGNRGCLETVVSVSQVLALMQPAHDRVLSMAGVVELVRAGDAGASRVLADTGRILGRVLADLVNNLNPEVLVLGGELSLAGEPLLAGVRESLDRFAQPGIVRDLRLRVSELAETAQLHGAAVLALASQ